jgi:DNA-binding LacI/PurR family transcriptional regulator
VADSFEKVEAVPAGGARQGRTVTIADVARRAGVGAGTVSRVLNGGDRVSENTRRRVLAVIAELDYRPSQAARNLSLGRTSTLGAVVPFFTHASAVERLRGLVPVLTGGGYDFVLFDVETREQRDNHIRNLARRGRADGVVIVSLPLTDDEVARFRDAGTPLVLLDTGHEGVPHVVIDNVRGGQLATEHLIALGHRRIAFVGDPPTNPYDFTSSVDRRSGYVAALERAGIAPRPEYVKEGSHNREVALRLTEELLSLPEPPTAVFVASDTQALGVLEAARRHEVVVPDALSVIGFDDIEVSRLVGLTTVRQPLEESGARAGAMLLAALSNGDGEPTEAVLPLEVVFRETTAPPRAG